MWQSLNLKGGKKFFGCFGRLFQRLALPLDRPADLDRGAGQDAEDEFVWVDRLDPKDALTTIAHTITSRARDPESAALFRIVATEAMRFPELATKMRDSGKQRWEDVIADYFRGQIKRGSLRLTDPNRAAVLFLQMICAELHECLLFGKADAMAQLDFSPHLTYAIDIFLFGAASATARPTAEGV